MQEIVGEYVDRLVTVEFRKWIIEPIHSLSSIISTNVSKLYD